MLKFLRLFTETLLMGLLRIGIFFILFINASYAKEVKFSLGKNSGFMSFDLSKGWSKDRGIPGSDHLFTYSHDNIRDLISVLISPETKVEFTASKSIEQKKYEQAKTKWAKKRGVKIKKFFQLQTAVKDKMSRYLFGVNYTVAGRDIIEYSHYYFCHDRIVNIKLLGDNKKSFVEAASRSIQGSVKCLN